MFSNESAMDELALVNRLISYQQDQGDSISSAVDKVKLALPGHYKGTVEVVEKILDTESEVALVGYDLGSLNTFVGLASFVREEGGDVRKLFFGAKEGVREALFQAREYWSGFNSLIFYFVVALILVSIVTGIFMVKVLPSFESAFSSFGVELPSFTQFVLSNVSLVIVFLCIAVTMSAFCAQHVRKRVSQFKPLSSIFEKIPVMNKLKAVYSYFLFLHFTNSLILSGLDEDISFNHAKYLAVPLSRSGSGFQVWFEAMESAKKMGVLEQEVEFQISQISSLFSRQMIVARESLALIVQLFLGFLIGTLVIAMYLPIFKLGTVV